MPDNEHYVPQFLLKNFGTGTRNNQIHVFDKHEGKKFRTNVRNVASESGFYQVGDFKAEKLFERLDKEAHLVINKIIQRKNLAGLTSQEISWLYTFVASQKIRTRQFREEAIQMNQAIEKKIIDMGGNPKDVENFDYLDKESVKTFSLGILFNNFPEIISGFTSKFIVLMEAPKGNKYYISDNPLTLQNENDFGPYGNLGLKVLGIEIYLPLSPYLTLAFLCPSFHEKMLKGLEDATKLKSEIGLRKKFDPFIDLGQTIKTEEKIEEIISKVTDYVNATTSGGGNKD